MKEFCLIPKKVAEKYIFSPSAVKSKMADESTPEDAPDPIPLPTPQVVMYSEQPPTPPASSSPLVKKVKGGKRVLKKQKPIFLKPLSITKNKAFVNPPLTHIIEMKFKRNSDKEYTKAMLTYFTDKNGIQWNKEGDLTAPFTGYNIIDVIKELTLGSKAIRADKVAYYKMLIDYSFLPRELVKNSSAVAQLYRLVGGKIKIKRRKSPCLGGSWISYV